MSIQIMKNRGFISNTKIMLEIKNIDKAKALIHKYQAQLEDLKTFSALQRAAKTNKEYIPIQVRDASRAICIDRLEANGMMQEYIMVQLKYRATLTMEKLVELGIDPANPFDKLAARRLSSSPSAPHNREAYKN